MLTGDNPLTACHVAKELKIATRKTLVLKEANEGVWHWQSIGGGTTVAMETSPAELGKTFDLCLTGDVSLSHTYRLLSFLSLSPPYLLFSPPLSLSTSPSISLGNGLCTKSEWWKDV